MTRLHCPGCRQRPVQVVVLRSGIPICGHCRAPLQAVHPLPVLPAFGALLLGAGLAFLSQQPKAEPRAPQQTPQSAVSAAAPQRRPIEPELQPPHPDVLLSQLAEADQQWIPRVEPLPSGGVRYLYKRRSGEPELELAQIRALIANPPSFHREQQGIRRLLLALQQAGVSVDLRETRKPGAAGEWDPARRALRIQPRVVEKGSLDFATVLNHEAIHVAQSCRGGGVTRSPQPLGLSTDLSAELESHLAEPVYARASALEQQLEREAYANQHNLELGLALLRAHCRVEPRWMGG